VIGNDLPSPAQIRVDNECSHDRPKNWTCEQRACKTGHCESAFPSIPEVRKCTAYDSYRGGAEEALEKPEDHDTLDVRSNCHGDLEDGLRTEG